MTDIVTAAVKAIVRNVVSSFITADTERQIAALAHGQLAVAKVHGDYFEANFRGKVFSANVTAVTIPVVANGLVSVFTLWNPPSSGVIGEIISTMIGQVLATTVVDEVAWYSSTAAATGLGTFTTLGVARSCRVQDPAANAIKFYSAFTHSGTPTREEFIGGFGATADVNFALPDVRHNGRLLLPEGIAMSVAMSTAAGTTSGLDIEAVWAEWPSR